MKNRGGFHYSVACVRNDKAEELVVQLNRTFPAERGRIFIPAKEVWMRGWREIATKTLFPGYIFVHTDMNRQELHEFIRDNRGVVRTYVRELGIARDLMAGDDPYRKNGIEFNDLNEDETEYLDHMLDDDDIIRMSVGHIENGWAVVEKGPLKGWEDRIFRVNRHDRVAFLTVEFRGHRMSAGLELK